MSALTPVVGWRSGEVLAGAGPGSSAAPAGADRAGAGCYDEVFLVPRAAVITLPDPEIARRAAAWSDRVALVDARGSWDYGRLLGVAAAVARRLLGGRDDLDEARVAFLLPPTAGWAAVQWGIWRAGGVAVPLAASHPPAELDRALEDAEPEAVVVVEETAARLADLVEGRGVRLVRVSDLLRSPASARGPEAAVTAADAASEERPAGPTTRPGPGAPPGSIVRRRAMIVYTSGTTGRPKGVVTTHGNLEAQVRCLVGAWHWAGDDRILGVLPLHHVHGIVNVLSCALWSGACCELRVPFDVETTWERLASGEITVFMAVPAIYRRLIDAWEEVSAERRRRWADGARGLRLMVSGSAALPVPVLERWEEITGHRLLERYGMTEIGMALSNPLEGERRAGTVGRPLPGVEAHIVDDDGEPVPEGNAGEIEVRGPQVFLEYWRRPEATRRAFRDGWFRTGDEGLVEDGYWRIVGRRSVDIVNTGGFKVSALEVEAVLRDHPGVAEVAVVGVDDDAWGERLVAAVVVSPGAEEPSLEGLRAWCKERLAPYKAPRQAVCLKELPRNAMGKVVKPRLREILAGAGPECPRP